MLKSLAHFTSDFTTGSNNYDIGLQNAYPDPVLAGLSFSFALLNQASLHIYCALVQSKGNMRLLAAVLAPGAFLF